MFAAMSRVFRETVGETPMQYVLANRIEQAVAMMKDPARPLGDIALACGFADQAHFNRRLVEWFGVTPSLGLAQLDISIVR